MKRFDIAIIGGGIIGLATAYQILRARSQLQLVILEKESELATHQTGHNSGVLHSGIYYQPGSLKAVNCRQGKIAMQEFCEREQIHFEICGKVIVATSQGELPALQRLYQRGQQNGVKCELIDAGRLHELEPHAAGLQAIHVPEAGIVDFRQVCGRLTEIVRQMGGEIQTSSCVTKIVPSRNAGTVVETSKVIVEANLLINCAGLHCDRVAQLCGHQPKAKIVPFRGEYYELKPDVRHLCRNLIYPVPEPNFPFLGVHFTRMINGSVECGPNAVLALAREGYKKSTINPGDMWDSLTYRGFWRLALKHWKMGCGEIWRSLNKGAFVKALQKLIPEIRSEHLVSAPAGVRAQALLANGQLVDDFLIVESPRAISINNAPSPAATASLNIGRLIADKVLDRL